MEERRVTDPNEEKTCTDNDMSDNELLFRDLLKVTAEQDTHL